MAIFELGERVPSLSAPYWVADNATLIGSVELRPYASIWFNAVIRADNARIQIGEKSNIQDGCVLHTDQDIDLTIEDSVTVGHLAMLHGCKIGRGTLIGIKSVILNNAVIGRHCIIGANTLIPEGKVIPERSMVVGSPGRVVRELTDQEVAKLELIADRYVENWQRYQQSLKPAQA